MADKLIQIIIKGTVKDAEDKIKELEKVLKDFEHQVNRTGAAATPALDGLRNQFDSLEKQAGLLREEAAGLRQEIEADAEGFNMCAAAEMAAAEAAGFLGAAFVALKLGEKAVDIAKAAAAGIALRDSFHDLASSSGVDSELLLKSLDKAAKGTVSDYDLMRAANAAWYLGISQNIGQYTDLMKIAEEKSKDLSMTTTEYWERMTNALASGYPMGLRQLGIVIDNERAYQTYAASIGKATDELTDQEQIQARVNAVIADGTKALEDWESAEIDATTATQQFDAATANLRDTIKEGLLPVLLPAIDWITKGLEGIEAGAAGQNAEIAKLIEQTGSSAAAEEAFAERITITSQGLIDRAEATRLAHTAMLDYRLSLLGVDKGIQEDIEAMRMAEKGTIDWGQSTALAGADLDDLARKVERAADATHDYFVKLERQNWQFTQRVEALLFRQTQAAEDAAFRLIQIERTTADRIGQTSAMAAIEEEADTARHYNDLRRLKQDLQDDLSDMEWDYQQDRKRMLEEAPWWIRNELQQEYAERARIARTGDKQALADYDKHLNERIKAIDPAYAKELALLQKQHQHEERVERREARQSLQRKKEDWRIENREQERKLDQQLRNLETALQRQLDEWEFHNQQRLENETHAMEELRTQHTHQLDTMYEDLEYRLGRLPDLWKDVGYQSWLGWLRGLGDAQQDYGYTPMPGPGYDPFSNFQNPFAPSAQFGMPYVPRSMGLMVHQGEAVLNPRQAEHWRGGGITIGEIHLHGNYTPFLARKMAREFADELGPMIRERSR